MATVAEPILEVPTLADLLERLGDIPLDRICARPAPGTATEADVQEIHLRTDRLFELIEGVLVEKAMGYNEACLALLIGGFLNDFVRPRKLGVVAGADGMLRLAPGLVLIPDVSFCSWDRFPGRRLPTAPIPDLVPDLAVEVLSKSNTAKEMARKRREYFAAGTRLVWEVDPLKLSVSVWTSPERSEMLDASATLDGGDVLPGFALPLRDLFAELDTPD